MKDIREASDAEIRAEIARFQSQQKRYPATSPIHAEIGARLLAPLFAEMARRASASGPTTLR
jgi:hypothetical protein